jgi:hypothetical protein
LAAEPGLAYGGRLSTLLEILQVAMPSLGSPAQRAVPSRGGWRGSQPGANPSPRIFPCFYGVFTEKLGFSLRSVENVVLYGVNSEMLATPLAPAAPNGISETAHRRAS